MSDLHQKSIKQSLVAVFGGGKMGGALVQGWLTQERLVKNNVFVIDPDPRAAERLRQYGVLVEPEAPTTLSGFDAVIVAVKPNMIATVLEPVAKSLAGKLTVSIAAGLGVDALQSIAPDAKWVRAMPNQPVTVGMGATGLYARGNIDDAERSLVAYLFDAVGISTWVQDEALMHAITGLSGSGPAFVAVFAEAMEDAGVRAGLPRDAARRLALNTIEGAAKQIAETCHAPSELKDAVTSPGGTTIAGIEALEAHGLRKAVQAAVAAATRRSHELGASS